MYKKVTSKLFARVDNSPVILFRIVFGIILFCESVMDIFNGRVRHAFIIPRYRFPFIGFEFLHPLPGNGMYYFFWLMAVLGIMTAVGAYYRLAMAGYTLLWAISYFMDKPGYQNHYYLVLLLCSLMVFMPAHRYYSIDVKRRPQIKQFTCPRWVILTFIAQMAIVYFYAGINKIYPDWLNGTFIGIELGCKSGYPVIGSLLKQQWLQWIVIYGGILFDLSIIPLLLWKRTRRYAFIVAIAFNLFNAVIFRIGIFPYLALLLCVFFFGPQTIQRIFFRRKKQGIITPHTIADTKYNTLTLFCLGIYFIIQMILPVRHLLYPGNTMWTEEGSRLSWRMMLRKKTGDIYYKVVDPASRKEWVINPGDSLTGPQSAALAVLPDMIWQFAQYLEVDFAQKGIPGVEIYAISQASLNNHPEQQFIDPTVNLAKVKWSVFRHSTWIKP